MMNFVRNIRVFLPLFAVISVLISGCASNDVQNYSGVYSSASRASDSRVESPSEISPLEAHLRARKLVDPADTSSTHRYTYLAEDYQRRAAGSAPLRSGGADAIVPSKKPAQNHVVAALEAPVQPSSKSEAASSSASTSSSYSVRVTALRVGDHPDKTRLVLDVSGATKFDYKMDDKKNVLVVTLHDAGWSAAEKRVFSGHPLLLAYLAKPAPDGGTFLAIKMKKSAQILFKTSYPPSAGKGYRIVMDVAPL